MKQTSFKYSQLYLVVLLGSCIVALLWFAVWRFHDARDLWLMRGYTPPTAIEAIAQNTTMTTYGRRLFYVNHPQILSGAAFTKQCTIHAEKSIVLGCYKSGDNGIAIYNVNDTRLQGVKEVTAAHEVLHAGYDRLSNTERKRIDTLLQAYAKSSLRDDRINDILTLYRSAEPGQLANEMHSIFATELGTLNPELEAYYRRYFTNRQKVVALADAYQAEFTSRRQRVADFDTDLQQQKIVISSQQDTLAQMRTDIEQLGAQMEAQKAQGDIRTYNANVDTYNQQVQRYSELLQMLRQKITAYNTTVEARNTLAFEERSLMQALSPKTLPAVPSTTP